MTLINTTQRSDRRVKTSSFRKTQSLQRLLFRPALLGPFTKRSGRTCCISQINGQRSSYIFGVRKGEKLCLFNNHHYHGESFLHSPSRRYVCFSFCFSKELTGLTRSPQNEFSCVSVLIRQWRGCLPTCASVSYEARRRPFPPYWPRRDDPAPV